MAHRTSRSYVVERQARPGLATGKEIVTRKWRSSALLGIWVICACGGEESTPPRPACTEPVRMAVTPEARPLFIWTPDCVIGALQVGTPTGAGAH